MVWRIGLFVLHGLDPNKGVVFRGRTRGWTVRGLEGDFCSVLVAVSGGAEGHPWCSSVTGSIKLDRYVPHFLPFSPFYIWKLGFGAVEN